MIRTSFIFLEKIGPQKERNLWQQGIKDWPDFLKREKVKGISKAKKYFYGRKIKSAQQALLNSDAAFFLDNWPVRETWRLYSQFKEETGYLDVEIDNDGKIVLLGISNYYTSNFLVKGINLESGLIEKELSRFKLIITFNGAAFDLPKLKKQLGIEIKVPHLDLKPLCTRLGWKGGLKEVELALNLKRPQHLQGHPVELWKAFHASGDKEYLDLLIEYNREDIENLKAVMDCCYRELSKKLYKQIELC